MANLEQEAPRLVVIGASAGGVEAISALVGGLPDDFGAAVCIVLHMSARSPNLLSSIIGRRTHIPTKRAEHGDLVKSGFIYVVPADHHLLFDNGHLHLSSGPKQNRHRPSIDVLFQSAADVYGPRVIGCILTGYLDDGTAGLQAIKDAGGIAVVQDPSDALVPDMPVSALRHVQVDHSVPLAKMAPLLEQLLKTEWKEDPTMDQTPGERLSFSDQRRSGPLEKAETMGRPGVFVCPDCSGSLWEKQEGKVLRFTCHLGHAFSPEGLLDAQSDELERSLYVALRMLRERADLLTRLAAQTSWGQSSTQFEDRAREHKEHADVIQDFLEKGDQRKGPSV